MGKLFEITSDYIYISIQTGAMGIPREFTCKETENGYTFIQNESNSQFAHEIPESAQIQLFEMEK